MKFLEPNAGTTVVLPVVLLIDFGFPVFFVVMNIRTTQLGPARVRAGAHTVKAAACNAEGKCYKDKRCIASGVAGPAETFGNCG